MALALALALTVFGLGLGLGLGHLALALALALNELALLTSLQLCPLKCHLVFLSYRPGLTTVQHTASHTTDVQSPSHCQ